MKNKLFVITLIIALGTLCQLFADDVVISSFPHTESFEGATFPPDGWVLDPREGQPNLTLEIKDSVNPTIYDTPYGENWVSLQYNPLAQNDAVLWSPRLDFPTGDTFYRLTMSRYVTDNTYSTSTNAFVQINRNSSQSEFGPYMGQIHTTDVTGSLGWQDYSVNLGYVGGTSQYLSLIAVDDYEALNFDNIRIEESNPWNNRNPQDGSYVDAWSITLYWSDYAIDTNLYSLYLSTDNINFTLAYQGSLNSTCFDYENPLLEDTIYYWYVEAREFGHTVTSPVWSFDTGAPPIEPPAIFIDDFPYLADFQLEDPLWTTFPMNNKSNSGKLNAEINPLLQTQSANMSKYDNGYWVRSLDSEANYTWMLPLSVASVLASPYFHLIGGETYEVKYNYRISEPSVSTDMEGLVLASDPRLTQDDFLDTNFNMTNTGYALRMVTVTPQTTGYYMFGFIGFSSVNMYFDNFRITQNGDDVLTAAAPTLDGTSTPDPAPIYNTETQQPLDTALHIANITGTPEITATVSWTAPAVGSQNSGIKLNLHSSNGSLAGANVTFIHNLGYPPLSASYRIVPNSFSTMYNPNDGSWTASQCVFTVPNGKADGDYEVILQLSGDETLPVELSSFTAIATQQNYVQLEWVTQSETGVSGYYIYRNSTNDLAGAQVVSNLISAHNTSQLQAYTYTDREVQPGSWYYWLQNMDTDGQMNFYGSINVVIQETDDNGTPVIPLKTSMQSIYPNPFNPSTTIAFGLAKAELVNIQIYNMRGQLIRNLLSETKQANNYSVTWDGTNDNGKQLPSGVYYARMSAGKYSTTRKLVIMK